ncbi:MAG: V-type ATPase subunit subunit G family protein [Candidatus Woesearchaeota archaeon]|jgi:vacuolar-type H+-ATPase subunit H|nr:V-type ATPase subunit subunit G family protein [Candidatus Woesearchaeota archaeon]|tara:strand:- start:9973 stop:10299 length:327 start_codon:yes stop_codon:yes gene_type:complete
MDAKETEILTEIRGSEKRAEQIIEKANGEKKAILDDAIMNSSELLNKTKEEIRKLQEQRTINARDKAKSIKEEKLKQGKKTADQLRKKVEKNINKAVDFVMEKFEEMI